MGVETLLRARDERVSHTASIQVKEKGECGLDIVMGVGRNKQTPPFDYGKKEKSVNVPIHQYKNPPICKKEKEYMTSIIHRQEKHNVNLLLWLARLKKKRHTRQQKFRDSLLHAHCDFRKSPGICAC